MIRVDAVRSGWNRFWFTRHSTATVELVRIAFGLLATLWMLSLLPVYNPFFGPERLLRDTPSEAGQWTVFTLFGNSPLGWLLWFAGLVAALALTVGCATRLAAVVVFVVVMSFTREAPWVFNSGDGLVRALAFYVMLMPAGSAVSVDARLRDRSRFWTFPHRPTWALRLAQIQLSLIYLSTVWEKAGGTLWRDGTAVSFSLRSNVARFPVPAALTDSATVMQLATFGTLAVELALGVLVWNRAARPWVLALGVLLHVSIDVTMTVGFFGLGMLTLYLAFVSPQTAEQTFDAVRRAVLGRRRRSPDPGAVPSARSTVPTSSGAGPDAE